MTEIDELLQEQLLADQALQDLARLTQRVPAQTLQSLLPTTGTVVLPPRGEPVAPGLGETSATEPASLVSSGLPAQKSPVSTPSTPPSFVTRRVEAHGLGIHITDWGTPRQGPGKTPAAVVMLHALGFTGRLFDPLARALGRSYRVLCPDIRGHGRTDHPPEGYQYPNLVRDLAGMIQMLHLNQVILVGHTWGADVAMSYAVAHPKKVAALILLDGGYKHRGEMPKGAESAPTPDKVKSAECFPSIEAAVEDARLQLGQPWTADLEAAIIDSLVVRRDKTVAYRLDDHRWSRIYKALWAYDPTRLLTTLQLPTLIVHPVGKNPSSQEATVAAFQARAAQLVMHDAELLRLADDNNLTMLANPDLAEHIDSFIRGRLKQPLENLPGPAGEPGRSGLSHRHRPR